MRNLGLIVIMVANGCALDVDHVSTKLLSICTDDVPLVYTPDGSAMIAQMQLDGVGRAVDPGAHASLDLMEIEPINGIDDFSFAESITVEISAPGSALPDLRLAEQSPLGPHVPAIVSGDPAANVAMYLDTEELWLRSRIEAVAPVPMFTVRMQACLEVEGIEVEDP